MEDGLVLPNRFYQGNIPPQKGGLLPFKSQLSLADHYKRHKSSFPVSTAAEYEALCEAFLAKKVQGPLMEGKRRSGYTVRFDSTTLEICITDPSGAIRTYYKVSAGLVKKWGGVEPYFKGECER